MAAAAFSKRPSPSKRLNACRMGVREIPSC